MSVYQSIALVPTEPSALEDDEGGDQEPTVEPKRAEDGAEDRRGEEDEDEAGDEDKATVDVVKPLAEPEERESRAEAAGQRRSRTSAPPSPASPSRQPQGGAVSSPCFQSVPACTRPERPSPRPRPPKVGDTPPITALHCSSLTSRGTSIFYIVFYFIKTHNNTTKKSGGKIYLPPSGWMQYRSL